MLSTIKAEEHAPAEQTELQHLTESFPFKAGVSRICSCSTASGHDEAASQAFTLAVAAPAILHASHLACITNGTLHTSAFSF